MLIRAILLLACWIVAIHAVTLCLRYQWPGVLIPAYLLWRRRRFRRGGYAYGTARMANLAELCRRHMFSGRGLLIGRAGWCDKPTKGQAIRALLSPRIRSDLAVRLFLAAFISPALAANRLLHINDFVHVAAFAASGRGKGVSIIIPNLLTYPDACVVTDPKGENYAITAEARKRMGHKVFRLNPFNLGNFGSDSWNPLDCLQPDSPELADQCLDVANMLIERSGTEPDPHWNSSAEMVIASVLFFICACEQNPANRTLQLLRDIVSSPDAFKRTIEVMRQTGGIMTRKGDLLSWLKDKELASVMSTVQRQTAWLDSPSVAANLGQSSFDPRILRSGRASLYLILPHDRLVTLAPLMRLWIGSLLRILTRESVHAG